MISAIRKGKFALNLSNGVHSIVSDVARNLGGEDLGLNPHELVESALAACTIQTMVMYANRKGWELPELSVEVKIVKEVSGEAVIERKIHIGGHPEDVKSKLLEIANKCPIHKLLTGNIKIETYEK